MKCNQACDIHGLDLNDRQGNEGCHKNEKKIVENSGVKQGQCFAEVYNIRDLSVDDLVSRLMQEICYDKGAQGSSTNKLAVMILARLMTKLRCATRMHHTAGITRLAECTVQFPTLFQRMN